MELIKLSEYRRTRSSSPSINALLVDPLEKSNGDRKIDREVGENVDINGHETNPRQACNRDHPGLFTDFERRSMEYNKLTATTPSPFPRFSSVSAAICVSDFTNIHLDRYWLD